ncbi:hypothetical protein SLEP1_g56148 [Rubroshorea leprosula]|uniref:Uncharacterized protein n=1 Tax=Rubroshorea leprosula TaxID=152421 RepID=A0AAV5MHM9_9ROSI|nr:hypothetical protein SLEP1_g56148 [Rubroshorea leprosula]
MMSTSFPRNKVTLFSTSNHNGESSASAENAQKIDIIWQLT